jgi:uncharacterized protein YndB with AHSA1/START domain
MPDIFHDFPIKGLREEVFDAVSTPAGMDAWWSDRSSGRPIMGAEYRLQFGPGYDWRAVVTRAVPSAEFELHMTVADADWKGTRVGFSLEEIENGTRVRFHHLGWPELNAHYRTSCFCWAMYLRCLRRDVESGVVVPYSERLDA